MSHPPPKRSSSEEKDADFNWPPADEELTQYFRNTPASPVPDDVGPAGLDAEDPSTSPVAVAQNTTALDGEGPGEWVAEVARLQELIEGLTQKLEWRIKSVGR